MKASLKMVKLKEREFINMETEEFTKVSSKMDYMMEKELINL